jgi:hypothetical protein
MSEFATMRFELKKPQFFHSSNSVKRPVFSRFSKSKPKTTESATVAAKIVNKAADNVHSIHELEGLNDEPKPETGKADEEPNFKLKYLEKLSSEHLLIGNQYQLDMLKVQTLKNSFIDVDYKWSICPSQIITSLSVDPKCTLGSIQIR